jgi:hypothetical protein
VRFLRGKCAVTAWIIPALVGALVFIAIAGPTLCFEAWKEFRADRRWRRETTAFE